MRRSLAVTMRLAVLVLSMGLDPRFALAAESELQAIRVLKNQGIERQRQARHPAGSFAGEAAALRQLWERQEYLSRASWPRLRQRCSNSHGRPEPSGHDRSLPGQIAHARCPDR